MASTSGQTGARSPALSVTHVHTGPPADGAAPLRAPWGLEVLQVKPSQTFKLPGRRAEAVPAQPPGHEQPGLGSHPRGLRAEQPALPRGWGSSEGRDPPHGAGLEKARWVGSGTCASGSQATVHNP